MLDLSADWVQIEGSWKRDGPPAMMVSQNSALLYSAQEHRLPCDADHLHMAKLTRGQTGVYFIIKGHIQQALDRYEVIEHAAKERSRGVHFPGSSTQRQYQKALLCYDQPNLLLRRSRHNWNPIRR